MPVARATLEETRREDGLVRGAGGLLWREEAGARRLAVIHRPHRGDWSLPKGKLRRGETFRAAAVREVAEETGCRAPLGEFAGYALYERRGRSKLVLFWHMAARDVAPFVPNDEVDRLDWLTPVEALARLDHEVEREVVRAAVAGFSRAAHGAIGSSRGGAGASGGAGGDARS